MKEKDADYFIQQPLAVVIKNCQEERSRFHNENDPYSPACVELFHRAFAEDQEAWIAITEIFTPLVRSWIGVQTEIQPEDITQQVWLKLWQYAPTANNLSPILAYLRKTVMTECAQAQRKNGKDALRAAIPLDVVAHMLERINRVDRAELRQIIVDRILPLLETDAERLIFHLAFVCRFKPSQILELYEHIFTDIDTINKIKQRIKRRLEKDEKLRGLYDGSGSSGQKPDTNALLIVDNKFDEQGGQMDEKCPFNETELIDYITGMATASVKHAIEASSVCMQKAQQLAQEIGPMLLDLYRITCPEVSELVAYQEKSLPSTERLVIAKHVRDCPLCSQELKVMAAMDAVPLTPQPSLARRIVEAFFQPAIAMPQPVRGTPLSYSTPEFTIQLIVRETEPGVWRLRGQLRTTEGKLVGELAEKVQLESDEIVGKSILETQMGVNGSFTFNELDAAIYRLRIFANDMELIINQIVIGDDI